MKKHYISPEIIFEPLEADVNVVTNSRLGHETESGAGDNYDEHSGGIGIGTGGNNPTDPPEEGDAKGTHFYDFDF